MFLQSMCCALDYGNEQERLYLSFVGKHFSRMFRTLGQVPSNIKKKMIKSHPCFGVLWCAVIRSSVICLQWEGLTAVFLRAPEVTR